MTRDEIAQAMQDSAGADWGTEAHFQKFAALVFTAELRRLHSVNAALLWALQQIADETYDVWTNGAKAQRIAERAIKEVQP
jgi:hypothetical protein